MIQIPVVMALSILALFSIAISIAILVGMLYLFEEQRREVERDQATQQLDNERDNRIQDLLVAQNDRIIANQDNATKFLDQGRQIAEQREDAITNNLTKRIDLLENGTKTLILQGREATVERFQQEQDQREQIEEILNSTAQSLNNTNTLIEQDENLTKAERQKLIVALRTTVNLVPDIKDEIESINNKINELFFAQNASDTVRSDVFRNITRPINQSTIN